MSEIETLVLKIAGQKPERSEYAELKDWHHRNKLWEHGIDMGMQTAAAVIELIREGEKIKLIPMVYRVELLSLLDSLTDPETEETI